MKKKALIILFLIFSMGSCKHYWANLSRKKAQTAYLHSLSSEAKARAEVLEAEAVLLKVKAKAAFSLLVDELNSSRKKPLTESQIKALWRSR